MQTTYVSPETLITGASPEARVLSPDAADIVTRIKAHYKEQGKTAAAAHYSRHLKALFSWSEAQGYSIRSLPADAVENFLSALKSAGQTDTTLYVTRTQLKAALVACQNLFGLEVGHVEYVTGRPQAVVAQVKANAAAKKAAAKSKADKSKAQAVAAAQAAVYGVPPPPAPIPVANYTPMDMHNAHAAPTTVETFLEDTPMTVPAQHAPPESAPAAAPVAAAPVQPQVIVVQQPAQASNSQPGVRATIGAPAAAQKAAIGASPPQTRGIVINNHTFTGAFVKISYVADGSNPFTPPGTETYVTTMPASQLAPHGDLGAFLQTFIIPSMRLSPTTSQVQFVFHELNDRRQPTGRRDELVVGIPLGPLGQQGQAPAQNGPLNGLSFSPPAPSQQESATAYLLKKLDEEAAEAKRRAEEYQVQMREAKDAQTTFMLMQAFQKEQDLRKELEEKRDREAIRLSAPPPVVTAPPPPMPLMPPMPMFAPEPPKAPDTSAADMVKALAEQQAKMMEVMMAGIAANRPPPPPPQKDTAEWLVPFISSLNQQQQAQQQANQQMLLGIMQSNQQFMQAMLQKESPVEKMLFAQLQEVKAAASAPKEDELESFADKLQKMKMVSDMMGGGGGGSMLTELLANADTIGAGIAKVVDSAKGNGAGLGSAPTQQVQDQQRQLAGAPAAAKALPPGEMPPPSEAVMAAHKALAEAVEKRDDEETAKAFLEFLKQMITAQEPYASMGRRLMTAYQQAEDEGELYTLAKNLWIVVGEKPMRPQAKYVARVLAEFYSDLHQSIFGEARTLPEDEETEEDEGSDEESAA
jgi:hypothetical protein